MLKYAPEKEPSRRELLEESVSDANPALRFLIRFASRKWSEGKLGPGRSERQRQIADNALLLACADLHGECKNPATCPDVRELYHGYLDKAEEAIASQRAENLQGIDTTATHAELSLTNK